MKIINLDKFAPKVNVTFEGNEYEVRIATIGDFIDGKFDKLVEPGDDNRAAMRKMAELIVEYSNIPKEIVYGFGMKMLSTVAAIIQGADVEEGTSQGNA